MSFARSAIISDMTQNSLGHGVPPKVSLKLSSDMLPMLMMHRAAVSPFRVTRLYAAFKSVFASSIFVFG